jgi:ATP-dependent Zn protease
MGGTTISLSDLGQPKIMLCIEYAKVNWQDSVMAKAVGHASANVMNEYAKATEELVENLTKKHTKQIEALIRSNNEAMAKLAESLLKAPVLKPSTDQNAKHKVWVEKCKTATK